MLAARLPSSILVRLPRWGLAVAAFALSPRAQAASCEVSATGADSAEWQRALLALSATGLTGEDCSSVRVDVEDDGARVTFTTPAGRQAQRAVRDASELGPTVEALRVTVLPPVDAATVALDEDARSGPAPEVSAQPAAPITASPRRAAEKVTVAHTERADENAPGGKGADGATPADSGVNAGRSSDSALNLSLFAGLRGGGRAGLVSPVLTGSVAWQRARWELGLLVSAEVMYDDLDEPRSPDRTSGALALGAMFGRREPVGAFDVMCGGRFAVASLLSGDYAGPACTPASCPTGPNDERQAEWRLGAYGGAAFPRRARLRFRADVAAEIAPADRNGSAFELTPEWAVTTLIGAELSP